MTTETGIYEYAKQGLALSADKPAIWFYGKSITYRELFEKIDNVADNLYALGVREGTVVTIHLPNCPQAVMAIYAVAKLGGICNMVHALIPHAALKRYLSAADSTFLITSQDTETLWDDQTEIRVISVDISAHMSTDAQRGYHTEKNDSHPDCCFESLEMPCKESGEYPAQDTMAQKCAFYLHSGGTTGNPKTIMLSHSAINNCVAQTADFFENHDMREQVSLCVLPLFHGFGLAMDVHRNISFGSTMVLMARWDVKLAVRLIKQLKVTLMVGVPTMYYALLNEADFEGDDIRQLSKCYVGGDIVPAELIEAFDSRIGDGHHLFVGFGMTEATTTDCVNTYMHYKAGSCGYPVRNTLAAVLDADGELREHGIGELVISGKTLMIGYLNDAEATERTLFEKNGRLWSRSGDEVEIDDDGFVFFRDRIKNIIIHNGYNIYPGAVEEIIRSLDCVKDVCLVGVENRVTHSQDVMAVVLPEEACGADDSEARIIQYCREQLPRYAVPKKIIFMSQFPLTPLGKVDRNKLRTMF